jgi:hypothetical protein
MLDQDLEQRASCLEMGISTECARLAKMRESWALPPNGASQSDNASAANADFTSNTGAIPGRQVLIRRNFNRHIYLGTGQPGWQFPGQALPPCRQTAPREANLIP